MKGVASSSWSSNPWVWVLEFKRVPDAICPGERPIIFSAPMILALLAGRKTQTRRVLKNPRESGWLYPQAMWGRSPPPNPVNFGTPGLFRWVGEDYPDTTEDDFKCPYGAPGDRLWVREGIRRSRSLGRFSGGSVAEYIADGRPAPIDRWGWKNKALPAIHMARGLCRIELQITAIRCERLHTISPADAIAEGIEPSRSSIGRGNPRVWGWPGGAATFREPRDAYRAGWEGLHG